MCALAATRPSARASRRPGCRAVPPRSFNEDIELEDAIHTALLTLKEGFDGLVDEHNVEIGIVGDDRKFRVLTPAEIKDYLAEVD